MTSSNGVNGKCMESHGQLLTWEMGIINGAGKYLTAEPFGYKLNVSATSLKKRQLWTIVPGENGDYFNVVSHLKRYLSADKDGRVTCEAEEKGVEEQFAIEYCPSGSGKWAFKSVSYNYYLTGSEDNISCFSKTPSWWSIRLAVHPQVHMQNQKRLRYVRLQNDELHGDQVIPWGYDSLVTLEYSNCGRVAVCSRDHRYLMRDGSLNDKLCEDALYGLEIHASNGGALASFRDKEGKYLTLIGNTGTLKSKNKAVGKDEMFSLEVSYPQVGLRSHNGKLASIKQGVDLYANQLDAEETETFQLEYSGEKQWKLRASNSKYWTVADVNNGIKATGNEKDPNCVFIMEHLPTGHVTLKAKNGLYVSSKKLGLMSATGENSSDIESLFYPILLNRPILILKSEFGLVGTRNNRVECSMSNYESFELENVGNGKYTLKDKSKEMYWTLGDDLQIRLEPSSTSIKQQFTLQIESGTHLALVASNERYIRGEQNGLMKADCEEITKTSLWEF